MKRGEIWTVSGGNDYAGKPRPAVIVQDDGYKALASITICPLTTDIAAVPLTRPEIAPSESNGLRMPSLLMVDKVTTLPKSKLGHRIGELADGDMVRLNRAMMVFLGLAARAG
ncbi:MAG TPA: type II toxin-antitoxin system PemK/MazF family toxin [Rhizomicrobium sp.]|jgi:mRNA interferase MazF